MNCDRIQRDILLDSSGELDGRRRARMRAHVSACAACRAYRNLLPALRDAAQRGDEIPRAPAFSVSAILLESERRTAEADRRRAAWLHFWRQPAFAAAAATLAFAIGLGAVWMHRRPAEPVTARAAGPAPIEWFMVDWMDVKLDLLSDELAQAADDADGEPRGNGMTIDELADGILKTMGV